MTSGCLPLFKRVSCKSDNGLTISKKGIVFFCLQKNLADSKGGFWFGVEQLRVNYFNVIIKGQFKKWLSGRRSPYLDLSNDTTSSPLCLCPLCWVFFADCILLTGRKAPHSWGSILLLQPVELHIHPPGFHFLLHQPAQPHIHLISLSENCPLLHKLTKLHIHLHLLHSSETFTGPVPASSYFNNFFHSQVTLFWSIRTHSATVGSPTHFIFERTTKLHTHPFAAFLAFLHWTLCPPNALNMLIAYCPNLWQEILF